MVSKLVIAHVLLQCADPDHKNSCKDLRDELMSNFLEVKRASTVEATGEKAFCVRGIAKINPERRQEFETALGKLQAKSANAKVVDVEVYVETANPSNASVR